MPPIGAHFGKVSGSQGRLQALKTGCLEPNPRDSDGIGLGAAWASRLIKVPQVILMYSQCLRSTALYFSNLYMRALNPTALEWAVYVCANGIVSSCNGSFTVT